MAGREDPRLRDIAQEALTIGDTASAVIFTVAPGSSDLELAAAAGVEGPPLAGSSCRQRRVRRRRLTRPLIDAGSTVPTDGAVAD